MKDNILSALDAISVADLTYEEWTNVGMALKEEGYSCSLWDNWSRNDPRYHHGECEKKWNTFYGKQNGIKGGTIIMMAKERGWSSPVSGRCLDWSDDIEDDGDGRIPEYDDKGGIKEPDSDVWDPAQDLIAYLKTLFNPEDKIGYVTDDVWQNDDGDWKPGKGVFQQTAESLIRDLEKHHDEIRKAVGDWKEEAGAWIRFNALDGKGVKNENVTSFKYALVESDELSVAEQEALYRKLELPIAALVYSGKKSLHAIVKVDAADYKEYRSRVEKLYGFLDGKGLKIDSQNKNPSRLSRMPGITRGGEKQYLLATNIGRKSWDDWMDFVEGEEDTLPEMVTLDAYKDNPPELPEELIEGILRRGHKMLVSGESKAGKSFLLMELSIAIAEGAKWLGFQCRKGRVLYVNLEIDSNSAICRFLKIYDALGLSMTAGQNIAIWNLRGHAVPLDKLVPRLIRRMRGQHYDAVVIDPIYKVITGDENSASDMGAFCNQFDKICNETGCSVIYCHHHSKGANGRKALDRASGSGVFARDPDAQLDMVQLEMSDYVKNNVRDGTATAWRLESNLREFSNFEPKNIWFDYPIHRLDESGDLDDCPVAGTQEGNLSKSKGRTTDEERELVLENAFEVLSMDPPVTINGIAVYADKSARTIREWLKQSEGFEVNQGNVFKKE